MERRVKAHLAQVDQMLVDAGPAHAVDDED
jgi:hypothetical protein